MVDNFVLNQNLQLEISLFEYTLWSGCNSLTIWNIFMKLHTYTKLDERLCHCHRLTKQTVVRSDPSSLNQIGPHMSFDSQPFRFILLNNLRA